MEVLKKIWSWMIPRLSYLHPGFPGRIDPPDLAEAVRESLREWKLAKAQFNYVETGLIDYMVFRLNAAERHYMALLYLAKTNGVKAWPDNLNEPVKALELETGDWKPAPGRLKTGAGT